MPGLKIGFNAFQKSKLVKGYQMHCECIASLVKHVNHVRMYVGTVYHYP